MTTPPVLAARLAQWREDRAAWALYQEGQRNRAEAATNGNMLNTRGLAAGVSTWSLFVGPGAHMRQRAYASQELADWFDTHPWVSFQAWETQHGRVPGRSWGDLLALDEGLDLWVYAIDTPWTGQGGGWA